MAAARELLARYDFASARCLVDVGGGSGGIALTIVAACPQLRATVVDLPPVTRVTRRYVEETGLANRVDVLPMDVVQSPVPGSFDVAVMMRLIQVLSADQARRVLRHVQQMLEPGGVLYIVGQVLDNARLSLLETVVGNIFFLNIFEEGQAYTEQEHRDRLAEAGFTRVEPRGRSAPKARRKNQQNMGGRMCTMFPSSP